MMSIDRLNSAAWAAGFAMAPIEDEPQVPVANKAAAEVAKPVSSGWRSAKLPAANALVPADAGGMRQWLASWQRKATA